MAYLYVINSIGEKEPFSSQKLYRAILRVGAPRDLAEKITEIIERHAYPGIKTSEIFEKVKELLLQKTRKSAMRFNLREGMRRLGPTGFVFEKFIGDVFEAMGFEVKINQYLAGFCLDEYEIDLIARKENLIYVGELKYRNVSGDKVHIQDALANHARFIDIMKGPFFKKREYDGCKIKTILVTNEKFTDKTITYSLCSGVGLLGWRYPKGSGLEYVIEQSGLYPVTLLSSLKGHLKDIFVSENIMLIKDVLKLNPQNFAAKHGIPAAKIYPIIEEAKDLLGN
jgi:hypothetical protein